jgi:hypothetical protein
MCFGKNWSYTGKIGKDEGKFGEKKFSTALSIFADICREWSGEYYRKSASDY